MEVFADEVEIWLEDILANHYEEALARANSLSAEADYEANGCITTPTTEPRKVRLRGRQMSAYRLIYCVANDVALSWHEVVRHRCHNRRCINPDHLVTGDRRDNKHDDWDAAANGVDHRLL
jgi:homing endonuclease-like protein